MYTKSTEDSNISIFISSSTCIPTFSSFRFHYAVVVCVKLLQGNSLT